PGTPERAYTAATILQGATYPLRADGAPGLPRSCGPHASGSTLSCTWLPDAGVLRSTLLATALRLPRACSSRATRRLDYSGYPPRPCSNVVACGDKESRWFARIPFASGQRFPACPSVVLRAETESSAAGVPPMREAGPARRALGPSLP